MNLGIRWLSRRCAVLALGILACSGHAWAADAQPGTFTLKYNPPDGLAYTVTCKTTRTRSIGSQPGSTTSSVTKEMDTVVKTADGYAITVKPQSVTRAANSDSAVNAQLQELALSTVLTLKVSPDGQLSEVLGVDEFVRKFQESLGKLDAATAKQMSGLVGDIKTATIARTKAEWGGRISSFTGRTARIGDVWVGRSTADLPIGGVLPMDTKTSFVKQVKRGGHDCVHISFTSTPDPKETKRFVNDWVKRIAAQLGPGQLVPKVLSIEVSGSGDRVVDPSTLLIYSETTRRTIKITIDAPGQGTSSMTQKEYRTYSYDYAK